MVMKYTFDVTVSQEDADVALRRFVLRGLGWSTLLAFVLCFAYLVYDVVMGGIGLLSVVVITLFLVLLVVYVVLIRARRKQMAGLLERLGGEPISYRLDDLELSTETSMGGSKLKWEMIEKLWIDPDLTLVFYSRNGYTTLPTDQVPVEALAFLADRVRNGGGVVTDNTTLLVESE